MKNFKLSILTLIAIFASTLVNAQNPESLRDMFIENRSDSSTWNMEFMKSDLSKNITEPMHFGAFPTPSYSNEDPSFNGLQSNVYPGVQGLYKEVNGRRILYSSGSIGKNSLNEEQLGDRNSETFFHLVVLADSIDATTFKHLGVQVISRNHPDYAMQGFFETSAGSVDYIAFHTATDQAFALVNMRLFDLSKGKTILIAPYKDGSFRSMQVDSPLMSGDEVDGYTDELLQQTEVVEFFTAPGAIEWKSTTD